MNSGGGLSAEEIARVPLDEVGRRLTAVLDRIGTRRSASEIAERSVDQLAKYEKGTAEPPFSGIARLCLAAGVRMEWLATGEEPMLAGGQVREPRADPYGAGAAGAQIPGQAAADADAPRCALDAALFSAAIRVIERGLRKYGVRDRVNPESYAELVRIMYGEMERGSAEDAALDALGRILTIARTP